MDCGVYDRPLFQDACWTSYLHPEASTEQGPPGICLGAPTVPPLFIGPSPAHNIRTETYADDNKIFGNPLIQDDQIQLDLDNMALWSQHWMIPLNPSKCTVLHLGLRNLRRRYLLENLPLTPVSSQVNLGIIIQDNLEW